MDDRELDQILDGLAHDLPAPLRNDWVVIPKAVLLKIALASALSGAAIALWITGIMLNIRELRWVFPVVLGAMAFSTRFIPWWREDRFINQLREFKEKDSA